MAERVRNHSARNYYRNNYYPQPKREYRSDGGNSSLNGEENRNSWHSGGAPGQRHSSWHQRNEDAQQQQQRRDGRQQQRYENNSWHDEIQEPTRSNKKPLFDVTGEFSLKMHSNTHNRTFFYGVSLFFLLVLYLFQLSFHFPLPFSGSGMNDNYRSGNRYDPDDPPMRFPRR